jgi:murein DD-endopeptidase MepM/ murein hydrolase activator NlpD
VELIRSLQPGPEDLAADVELRGTAVYTVRDGKVARVEFNSTRDEALEAVGLSE